MIGTVGISYASSPRSLDFNFFRQLSSLFHIVMLAPGELGLR